MNFVQFLELLVLLVPDFLLLGLVAALFFSLCCCVFRDCGLASNAGMDFGFAIALTAAYFLTIAVNVVSHLLTVTRITSMPRPESHPARPDGEFCLQKPRAQRVEQGGTFTAS
jgi:hypothetical protein